MIYALRYASADAQPMLVEVTRAELQTDADRYGGDHKAATLYPSLSRVSGDYAHRWVRQGYTHATALYIGEDRRGRTRVMYARDNS